MIFKTLAGLLVVFGSLSAAGFDDLDMREYFPLKPSNNGDAYFLGRNSFYATVLHSDLYGMESLNWNYFAARYDKRKAGLEFVWSAVGFDDYYQRNTYKITLGYNFLNELTLTQALEVRREDYRSFGIYTGINADIFLSYTGQRYSGGIGFAEIDLSRPYESPGYDKVQPFAAASWLIGKGLEMTVGIRRFENGRSRWLFDQRISVTRNLVLNFGYQNKPSNIRGGVRLIVKRFSFTTSYNSIGGLDDSVIWGIAFGE